MVNPSKGEHFHSFLRARLRRIEPLTPTQAATLREEMGFGGSFWRWAERLVVVLGGLAFLLLFFTVVASLFSGDALRFLQYLVQFLSGGGDMPRMRVLTPEGLRYVLIALGVLITASGVVRVLRTCNGLAPVETWPELTNDLRRLAREFPPVRETLDEWRQRKLEVSVLDAKRIKAATEAQPPPVALRVAGVNDHLHATGEDRGRD